MAKKKEDRQVVFRRVGGRIIPIAVGSGAIYGARRLDPGKSRVKALNKMDKSYSKFRKKEISKFNLPYFKGDKVSTNVKYLKQDNRKFTVMKRFYKKEISKSFGNPKHDHFSVTLNRLKPTHFDPAGSGKVSLTRANLSSLLHELGHAQQYYSKTKIDKLRSSSRYWPRNTYNKVDDSFKKLKFSKVFKKTPKFDRFLRSKIREPLVSMSAFAHESVVVAHETDAWRRGYKMAKGRKAKVNLIRSSLRPLWTYAASPATKIGKVGLAIGGTGLIAKGVLSE